MSKMAGRSEMGGAPQHAEAEFQAPASAPETKSLALEELLPDIPVGIEAVAPAREQRAAVPSLRTARLVALDGRRATIAWRGGTEPVKAELAAEVEEALLALALRNRDSVLVEVGEGERPVVVGVMPTRLPREMHIAADKILVEAAQEVVLRAGRAALRLREDGDVELVGSRISAASRGLFRIVGRVLRLN
jgi:hypothetical protein